MNHYLSLILFTPLVGAALLLFIGKQNENAIRWIANIFAFLGFVVSIPLWFWYNPSNAEFQLIERAPWIPSVGAEYFLGVDGLSVLLILLTTMRHKARAEAEAIVKNAERQIHLETARALQQIRTEAVDLSVMIASKLIQRNLTKEDNDRLIEEALRQVSGPQH